MMEPGNALEQWRTQIDELDRQLLALLAERSRIVQEIGRYKKAHGLSALDESRWQQVLQSQMRQAESLGLSPDFIRELYQLIHQHSLALESEKP